MELNEREAAFDILYAYFNSNDGPDVYSRCLARIIGANRKALITELVSGVLRHYIYIDYLTDSFLNDSRKLRREARIILRLAVYQIILTDKIPNYAAINEAVLLCKKRGCPELSGLVNAVLRRVADKGKEIHIPRFENKPLPHIEIACSVPKWIASIWIEQYGADTALRIAESLLERPVITICVNKKKTTTSTLIDSLKAAGVSAAATAHPNAIAISGTSDMTKLAAFKEGLFHVMDISAMMVADMLETHEGANVLDVCAAPGGKALYIAATYGASVTACDINAGKLALLRKSANRLGLEDCITTYKKDATVFCDDYSERCDYVLADVPCSGFGVLRKKPDIKLRRKPEDIHSLCRVQSSILSNCAAYVKQGGTLVYSTCTLNERENQKIIRSFLRNSDFTLVTEKEILPFENKSDGFYIARLVKNG